MNEKQTRTPDEDVLEHNVDQLLARAANPPQISKDARTRILQELASGSIRSADALLPAVYDELRKMAAAKLANERDGHSLNADFRGAEIDDTFRVVPTTLRVFLAFL